MARRNHRPGLRSATLALRHKHLRPGRAQTQGDRRIRTHARQLWAEPERERSVDWPPLLARLPGLAERPERNPEQGQVLDEELPRDRREGGEATETWLPDARRRDEEAQGREEHPHRQGATEGRNPRQERASGDEQRDG